jgi:phosphatidylglycerophosphate synthase
MTVKAEPLAAKIRTAIVGDNPVKFWGMSNDERTRRIVLAGGHHWLGADTAGADIIANAGFVWDPTLYQYLAQHPGLVITKDGIPVLAHRTDEKSAASIIEAMTGGGPMAQTPGMTVIATESGWQIENKQLRKRITPFVDRLVPANIPALERASYFGAYKGVTDILTKYLWPEWALVLTRIAAKIGMSPNQVTLIGFILCLLATYLMWFGHYYWGMAAGLGFMVLDTVDGKLARCTITSSKWGNVFDHGIDLVHPPFWYWAWAMGLSAWGLAYSREMFWIVMIAIVGGYVLQRLIEGLFIQRNSLMHIHVWEKIDSQFRLITARRNPNMVILFVFTLAQRPDLGLTGVAVWTVVSCVFHLVRLMQAELLRARNVPIRSWMDEI